MEPSLTREGLAAKSNNNDGDVDVDARAADSCLSIVLVYSSTAFDLFAK